MIFESIAIIKKGDYLILDRRMSDCILIYPYTNKLGQSNRFVVIANRDMGECEIVNADDITILDDTYYSDLEIEDES